MFRTNNEVSPTAFYVFLSREWICYTRKEFCVFSITLRLLNTSLSACRSRQNDTYISINCHKKWVKKQSWSVDFLSNTQHWEHITLASGWHFILINLTSSYISDHTYHYLCKHILLEILYAMCSETAYRQAAGKHYQVNLLPVRQN